MQALRGAASLRPAGVCPRGQEAVYAAGLLSLRETDLVSAELPRLRGLPPAVAPVWLDGSDALPTERLLLALGAASALRLRGGGDVVLAFAGADELTAAQWRAVLGRAATQALPVVVVALAGKRPGWLSSHAQGLGVPGIPVDAADAVALSRVLQESIVRARHGDGAALLEPVPWTVGRPVDPLRSMRQLLERRGLRDPIVRVPAVRARTARSHGK